MSELLLHSIGIIRTPFTDKYAAPRQPGAEGSDVTGTVNLEPGRNFEQALSDLEGFEKIWLLYHFDRNTNWKPQVLPPRSPKKRGVFATRSPHRPNALGLSLVTLRECRGLTLTVEGVDMLDNTPLFDIKPYLPDVESFPQARTGWLEAVRDANVAPRQFQYGEQAASALEALEETDSLSIRSHLARMLSEDIRPHPYKRISRTPDGEYVLAYKTWRIGFAVSPGGEILVRSVEGV